MSDDARHDDSQESKERIGCIARIIGRLTQQMQHADTKQHLGRIRRDLERFSTEELRELDETGQRRLVNQHLAHLSGNDDAPPASHQR